VFVQREPQSFCQKLFAPAPEFHVPTLLEKCTWQTSQANSNRCPLMDKFENFTSIQPGGEIRASCELVDRFLVWVILNSYSLAWQQLVQCHCAPDFEQRHQSLWIGSWIDSPHRHPDFGFLVFAQISSLVTVPHKRTTSEGFH
jgi:hypothetical protein